MGAGFEICHDEEGDQTEDEDDDDQIMPPKRGLSTIRVDNSVPVSRHVAYSAAFAECGRDSP